MVVATYNVRTLVVNGENGCEHDEWVLPKGREFGCDFIDVKE